MSLRVLLLTCAAATIAAIWTSPGRADLVPTPVELPAEVAATTAAAETAVAPVTAPVSAPAAQTAQQVQQVATSVKQAVSAATTPAPATPTTRGTSQARTNSAKPRAPQRAGSLNRRIDRAATAIRPQKAPRSGVLLHSQTKASPPVPLVATPSSAATPERNFPQFPGTPTGASSMDAASAGALFLVLALALFFLASAVLEFMGPLRLAPQLLRPQRYATPLDRPG
jgi:hypothetical protein